MVEVKAWATEKIMEGVKGEINAARIGLRKDSSDTNKFLEELEEALEAFAQFCYQDGYADAAADSWNKQ